MTSIVETAELGRRIRKLRLERRMTLKQVELAAGLSATHLSEIERGRTSPTIGALVRIARALERDASYFIEHDERSDVAHVSGDSPAVLAPAPGVRAESLTPGIPGSRLFAYRLLLDPAARGELSLEPSETAGQAIYFVRRGTLAVQFGEQRFTLAPGDAIEASLALPHVLSPDPAETVEVLAVLTRSLAGPH